MNKKIILATLFVLGILLVSGCTQKTVDTSQPATGTDITSPEEANSAVSNATESIDDLGQALDDLDNLLG